MMYKFLDLYFKGRKILVVDDDLVSSLLLREYLVDVDVDVVEAFCSCDALSIFRADDTIALVLLDILLPDENGYLLARKMRELKPNVPIIFQTALVLDENQRKTKRNIYDGYLLKPISKSELIDSIQRIIPTEN